MVEPQGRDEIRDGIRDQRGPAGTTLTGRLVASHGRKTESDPVVVDTAVFCPGLDNTFCPVSRALRAFCLFSRRVYWRVHFRLVLHRDSLYPNSTGSWGYDDPVSVVGCDSWR